MIYDVHLFVKVLWETLAEDFKIVSLLRGFGINVVFGLCVVVSVLFIGFCILFLIIDYLYFV